MKSKITLIFIVFALSLFDAEGQADTHSYGSFTPHEVYSNDSASQLRELENSQLLKRFAKSRKQLSKDPHRPLYHFVSPESMLNDPNGLCFFKGKWHMFYQAYPPDEFPKPIKSDIMKRRQHWGHAVSDDLIHWQDLPYAIYPDPEKMCFSGGTVVDGDTVYAFYPGIGAGQMAAKSSDQLLLNWEKITGKPVNTPVGGDACIWKEGDTFFALCGSEMIESKNMVDWKALGDILELPPHIPKDNNACPYFWPIGDKHLFLFFSHSLGGQYYLGDFDNERKKLKVYHHGRFNHGKVSPGGVHAPSAYPDPKNPDEIINIFNVNDSIPAVYWDQIMSLPQRYTLNPDKTLNIQPLESVESLRKNHRHVGETVLKVNEEIELKTINGNSMELELEIDQAEARTIQLNVLQSPDKMEKTSITFYNFDKRVSIWYETNSELCIDPTHASLSPDAWVRPPEKATLKLIENFEMPGEKPLPRENLKMRIFIDKSVVEFFAPPKRSVDGNGNCGKKNGPCFTRAEDSQASLIMPLALGVVPEKMKSLVLQRLVENIKNRNYHLSTGFVSNPYLLHGLTDLGRADLVGRIMNQKDYPSFYSVAKNGVFMETWRGGMAQMPSLGGSFIGWFYRAILGIRNDTS